MTNETSEALEDRILTTSLVLQQVRNLQPEMYPKTDVACMACPMAIWQVAGASLQCYCRVLYKPTWETAKPGKITICDAPLIAAAKAAEKAEAE